MTNAEILGHIALLSDVDEVSLNALASEVTRCFFKAGANIFIKGDGQVSFDGIVKSLQGYHSREKIKPRCPHPRA